MVLVQVFLVSLGGWGGFGSLFWMVGLIWMWRLLFGDRQVCRFVGIWSVGLRYFGLVWFVGFVDCSGFPGTLVLCGVV